MARPDVPSEVVAPNAEVPEAAGAAPKAEVPTAAAAGAPKAGAAAVVPNAEGAAAGVLPKAEVPAAAGVK